MNKNTNRYYDASKAHHTPQGFRNPEPSQRQEGDLRRWQDERKKLGLPKPPSEGYQQFTANWWQQADLGGEQDCIWWLGHASILLRLGGRYVLIDPVLSPRASPLSFYGPKRRTPPPLTVRQLPAVDVVLISHNHYDHLDRRTVRQLARRFPQATFIVPLGLKDWFRRYRFARVEELDWWDSLSVGEMTFHATPARHWSMRSLWDRNRSLWCGWVIHHPSLRFYFSGDSGYSERLAEIGDRLGPFEVAALPIGAYAPRWFMQEQHMDPQQSVKLYQQLKQPRVIPIHWGVFELADESLDDPPRQLALALSDAGLRQHQFEPLKIGQRIELTR
ncbi:MBL fold metallo-hydrolase [Serratia sp. AKBS12]|uniref:MBL fold metallo-hydrolase n=1 Tax=Serratia sp. AKBS12 TaxID=2974597 RepID=UPI0021661791|nr:MBL fold metallo-hydrolase [Serratia sp. AKBS12]MCS3408265.1 MBL fold metallo-hydrolase [Serratia sp. AKBS12]HEI8864596.1 MBL fold metallo-hydrolase [Serratia odorifera]HEI8869106.1 MBL fold metallo-hydrolase [Serratia odorifera]